MSQAAQPPAGVRIDDLDPELMALANGQGPFITVVMDTEADLENAGPRLQHRWKPLRQHLEHEGAPAELLDEVEAELDQARLDGPVVAVFGSADGVLSVAGPEPEGEDRASWDQLPRLSPVIAWHQDTPPALLVVIDRTGADMIGGGRGGAMMTEAVARNNEAQIRKPQAGGWSQRRYQQRAENSWRATAGEVADRLVEHVAQHETRLVVVAGEERAVQVLRDQLPDRVLELVRPASGHPGEGSEGGMADDARRWYRTAVAEDLVVVLERFKQELGQRDLAVAGAAETLAALEQASVETLLIHDELYDGRRCSLSPSGSMSLGPIVAEENVTDPADADEGGTGEAGRRDGARLIDAAIRAAWSTGSGVSVVPRIPELDGNIGALLRFRSPAADASRSTRSADGVETAGPDAAPAPSTPT